MSHDPPRWSGAISPITPAPVSSSSPGVGLVSGGAFTPVLAGLGVGVALASAPGPIQAVLLAETLRGGLPAGWRAQAGVNVVFAGLLVSLAFGLSVVVPGHLVLAATQVAGGALLALLGAEGLRAANRPPAPAPATRTSPVRAAALASAGGPGGPAAGPDSGLPGPPEPAGRGWRLPGAARGALAVLLNPGTWLFLGAVATPLFGSALRRGGTLDALLVALVILAGCAVGDTAVVLIGGFGVRRAGQRGRQWVQRGLAVTLAGLGAWFLIAGTAALIRA
jgi:threonine/homoserine/homoserine lactone efflux protein